MIVGIIGAGTVGGTLHKWFSTYTQHEVRLYDPPKGHLDFLNDCEAVFISVPVPSNDMGQDTSILKQAVDMAKEHTDKVFIRSTVLPGTNDRLGTISLPEFLTERHAFSDMCKYPILSGTCDKEFLERLFPDKLIVMMSNREAELAKYTHNAFGAMKVTYFHIINSLCEQIGAEYEQVLKGAMITGFIEPQHTKIALDGKPGYGGKCFPENVNSLIGMMNANQLPESVFFEAIRDINDLYRNQDEFTAERLPTYGFEMVGEA